MRLNKINVYVCDEDIEFREGIPKLFLGDTALIFTSFTAPKDMISYIKECDDDENQWPDIIITEAIFKNCHMDGIEAAAHIKVMCPEVIAICCSTNVREGYNTTPIVALRHGCDSWVEKTEYFVEDITHKVHHWANYVVEKNKLKDIYATILDDKSAITTT